MVVMSLEAKVTENEAKYLKMIYREQREASGKVRTTSIADSLGVSPATVTEILQNLSDKELLRHERYYGVELTRKGVSTAQDLLRKHRILEVLLVEFLGLDPEAACCEASKLDYHISSDLINSICQTYGHPGTCPCGKTIFSDPMCRKEGGKN